MSNHPRVGKLYLRLAIAATSFVTGNASAAALTAQPGSLSFSWQAGSGSVKSQTVTMSSGGTPVAYTVFVASGSSWLLAGPQTGSTAGANEINVGVTPTGLAPGTYNSSITVTPVTGGTHVTIAVTLTVTSQSSSTALTITPNPIALQVTAGGQAQTQVVSVSSAAAGQSFSAAATSTSNWLSVSPNSGVTPASVTLMANPSALAAGAYTGTLTLTLSAGGQQQVVNVTLTVTAAVVTPAAITVTPTSFSFSQTLGGAAPVAQFALLNSTGSAASFTALSSNSWLTVTPASGTTPSQVSISVSTASLTAGTYQSAITISGGSAPVSIPVTLSIVNGATPVLNPATLVFNYQIGGPLPAAQSISVASSGTAFTFTAAATANSGTWLSIDTPAGSTPALIKVTCAPTGLVAGQYTGTVTISPSGSAGQPQTASVSLTVTAPAPPVVRAILNAASVQPGPVSPGAIVTLVGSGLGPPAGVAATVTAAGAIESSLNGTRVLFDNIPAPVLYVKADQINAIVPYGIYGRFSTRLHVEVAGIRSDPLDLRVVDAAPAVFTANGSGLGQASVLNQDGTLNAPATPAPGNSIVSIYATGEGQTSPPGQDGRIIMNDLRKPLLPVIVRLGGAPAEVIYAGSAPSMVSGVMQINVRVPANIAPGGALPLEVQMGGTVSQAAVTMAVR